MTNILVSNPRTWLLGVVGDNNHHHLLFHKGSTTDCSCRIRCFVGYSNLESQFLSNPNPLVNDAPNRSRVRDSLAVFSGKSQNSSMETDDDGDDESEDDANQEDETGTVNSDILRENLERIVGTDDSSFSGIDLATLIRNKYGRSYDVQLIKKEFMGRNLLALNVMWKYMEQMIRISIKKYQIPMAYINVVTAKRCDVKIGEDKFCSKRSFPLTEEEYILRLDDVANNLKCWGAVSHIRNSLEKLKERPRIGKAVSIFIDMDESGGRANEWIYK